RRLRLIKRTVLRSWISCSNASVPVPRWSGSFTTRTSSGRSVIAASRSAVFEPEGRRVTRTQIFENAAIVLPGRVMACWLALGAERILEVGEGRAPERGLDCCGDLLVPGLIDLHTDHLENHLQPRPKVEWPPLAAVVAYDAQIAASGITTVFDCVRVGS